MRRIDLSQLRKELHRDLRAIHRTRAIHDGVPLDLMERYALRGPHGSFVRCHHSGLAPERHAKVAYISGKGARRCARAHARTLFSYPCPDHPHWHLTSRQPPPARFTFDQVAYADRVLVGDQWYIVERTLVGDCAVLLRDPSVPWRVAGLHEIQDLWIRNPGRYVDRRD